MEILTSCNVSSLNVYQPTTENPWNEERVSHVYRRLGFGATKAQINGALTQSPENFIDNIVDQAIALPPTPDPVWANTTYQDYIDAGLDFDEETQNNHYELMITTFNNMLNDGLRERLTFFWSNHFVTGLEIYYCSHMLFKYYNTLQTHALGNFEDFVRAIGKTEAMLIYLNGAENSMYNPNENYARELYELFTLGVNNGYTQTDIVETSKALTGYNHWTNNWCSFLYFDNSTFNTEDKTIFEQTGNWDYDDVIDILFQERAPLIANFICKKLYTFFVSPTINEEIVTALADIFVQDFNIANVLRVLFKSEHFFDSRSIGTVVKSPFDMVLHYLKTTNFTIDDEHKQGAIWLNGNAGQILFNPPDVAGWQRNHDWINSSTLTGRWDTMGYIIWHTWNVDPEQLRTFAIESSGYSNDPYIVTKSIIDRFMPKELHSPEDYDAATAVFKYDVPQNYYDDGIWDLDWDSAPFQVILLLFHIIKMPEFQLK